jgi:hypothetical protein
MSCFFASLMGLFGLGKSAPKEYKTTGAFPDLRHQVLSLDPATIGLAATRSNPVWGVVMETAYPEAVATLVTLGDGTVSLYFSNGGGIIGAGQHEGPRKAGEALLALAPHFISHAQPTRVFPLPAEGHTRFYFLCFDGVLTAEAEEADLGNNRLPLSPLFHKAHEVITAARLVDERQRGNRQP